MAQLEVKNNVYEQILQAPSNKQRQPKEGQNGALCKKRAHNGPEIKAQVISTLFTIGMSGDVKTSIGHEFIEG